MGGVGLSHRHAAHRHFVAGDGVGLISPAILVLCRFVEVSPNSGRQKGCSASVPEQETATGTPDLIAAKRVKTVCSVFRFILPD